MNALRQTQKLQCALAVLDRCVGGRQFAEAGAVDIAYVGQVQQDFPESVANLVEYLLLLSLIAIAVIGAVVFLGSQISPKFNQAGSSLSGASGP